MKKLFFVIAVILLPYFCFSSTSEENVKETIIENGTKIFLLEDYSNPLVRLEVNVRAGVSRQNERNAGFFELLSRLIQKSAKTKFDDVRCDADSTRFILNVSPSILEETLLSVSEDIFNPIFSDALLKQELSTMKREVLKNNQDPSYLINASIDARIFADEPWKHDTGIYPSLFTKISEENARVILNEIQTDYYTPQNTAIFVSGNIDSKEILNLIKISFGRFYSNKKGNFNPIKSVSGGGKKFVIHDKQFSDELTQIVVQYLSFEKNSADVAANILNDDYSIFKRELSNYPELNIPGGEYINVASAYKSGCTRLIFQSLMQNVKNVSPASQSELFLYSTKTKTKVSYDEFNASLSKSNNSYKKMISSSSNFMNSLSEFWTVLPYEESGEIEIPENYNSAVSYKMRNQLDGLKNTNLELIEKSFSDETPFVFVIMNTKQYNKYKKEFASKGYEEITSKNSSWYTTELYKNMNSYKDFMKDESAVQNIETDFASNFYKNNKASISTFTLQNGINLCVKENPNTTGVTFVMVIDGGNLRTSDNHGFEEVMTNILTTNMMRQIELKKSQNLVMNDYEIYSETNIDYSRIIIECDADDFMPVLNACANALILDDVIPTDADMVVQGRRTRKRLENGSTINQLYSAAIKRILPDSPYVNIFETEREILENTTYEQILQSYPDMLDAARLSFIVSGNVDGTETKTKIEKVFSVLQNQSPYKKFDGILSSGSQSRIDFPSGKQQKVNLIHTFLTDVSAKDAGPMPAVLIPTNSFADPVLFCIKAPDFGTDDFDVFNALLPYIQKEMSAFAENKNDLYNCSISAAKASSHIPMATISFSSVEKISACDIVFKNVIKSITDELTEINSSGRTLQNIKDAFIAAEFQDALTNTGSALLIVNAIHEYGKYGNDFNSSAYLEKYMQVNLMTSEQVLYVIEKYFNFNDFFKLYSADGK